MADQKPQQKPSTTTETAPPGTGQGFDDDVDPSELTPAQRAAKTRARRDALVAERKSKASDDESMVIVEIIHGEFIDGKEYGNRGADAKAKPPAKVGDVIEIRKADAKVLVANKIAVML